MTTRMKLDALCSRIVVVLFNAFLDARAAERRAVGGPVVSLVERVRLHDIARERTANLVCGCLDLAEHPDDAADLRFGVTNAIRAAAQPCYGAATVPQNVDDLVDEVIALLRGEPRAADCTRSA